MSSWVDLDGHVTTTTTDEAVSAALAVDLPRGSEGSAQVGRFAKGSWYISGSLRDRDEDDVPAIRAWFTAAVEALGAAVEEAELAVSGYQWLYLFRFENGRVGLVARPHEETGAR